MRENVRPATRRGAVGRRTKSRRPGGKLKPERVQEELKLMPGWSLAPDGNALVRTRKLFQPGAAARYAARVAGLAGAAGQPVVLGVTAHQVTLTLRRPCHRGIDMSLIHFARRLD